MRDAFGNKIVEVREIYISAKIFFEDPDLADTPVRELSADERSRRREKTKYLKAVYRYHKATFVKFADQYFTDPADRELISNALNIASEFYKDGVHYARSKAIQFALETATLPGVKPSARVIAAALLLDVPEFSRKDFDKETNKMIKRVNHLRGSPCSLDGEGTYNAQDYKDYVVSVAQSADDMLLMFSLKLFSLDEEAVAAEVKSARDRERIWVWSSLAETIGFKKIAGLLKEKTFSMLDRAEYKRVVKAAEKRLGVPYDEKLKMFAENELNSRIQRSLASVGVQGDVLTGLKTPFSIRRKEISRNKSIDTFHDIVRARILVDSLDDCYTLIEHPFFQQERAYYTDTLTEVSGYRKLRFVVKTRFGKKNIPVEVQIMTRKMYDVNERGLAHEIYEAINLGHFHDGFFQIFADEDEWNDRFWELKHYVEYNKGRTYFYLETPDGEELIFVPSSESGRVNFIDAIAHPEIDLLGRVNIQKMRLNGRHAALNTPVMLGDRIRPPPGSIDYSRRRFDPRWKQSAKSYRAKWLSVQASPAVKAEYIEAGSAILNEILEYYNLDLQQRQKEKFLRRSIRYFGLDPSNFIEELEGMLGSEIISRDFMERFIVKHGDDSVTLSMPVKRPGVPGGRDLAVLQVLEDKGGLKTVVASEFRETVSAVIENRQSISDSLALVAEHSNIFNSRIPVKVVQESDRVFRVNKDARQIEVDIDALQYSRNGLLALGFHHEYSHAYLDVAGLPPVLEEIAVLLEDVRFLEKLIAEGVVDKELLFSDLDKLSGEDKRYGDFLRKAIDARAGDVFSLAADLAGSEFADVDSGAVDELARYIERGLEGVKPELENNPSRLIARWASTKGLTPLVYRKPWVRRVATVNMTEDIPVLEPAVGIKAASSSELVTAASMQYADLIKDLKSMATSSGVDISEVVILNGAERPVDYDAASGILQLDLNAMQWPRALVMCVAYETGGKTTPDAAGPVESGRLSGLKNASEYAAGLERKGFAPDVLETEVTEFLDWYAVSEYTFTLNLISVDKIRLFNLVMDSMKNPSLKGNSMLLQSAGDQEELILVIGSIINAIVTDEMQITDFVAGSVDNIMTKVTFDDIQNVSEVIDLIEFLILHGRPEIIGRLLEAVPSRYLPDILIKLDGRFSQKRWAYPLLRDGFASVLSDEKSAVSQKLRSSFSGTDIEEIITTGAVLERDIDNLVREVEGTGSSAVTVDMELGVVELENGSNVLVPDSITESIKHQNGAFTRFQLNNAEALADALRYLVSYNDAVQSDPFAEKAYWDRLTETMDPLEPVTIVLDFRLLKEQEGAGFNEISQWLSGRVSIVLIGDDTTKDMADFLSRRAGFSNRQIEQIKLFSYSDFKESGIPVDRVVLEMLEEQAAVKGEAFIDANIRFLGHQDHLRGGLYGRYLASRKIPALYGNNLTSLAWAISCILSSENYQEVRDVLKNMGYSAEEIAEMVPDEDGNIPPLTVNRNYMEQLQKEREAAAAIDVMA